MRIILVFYISIALLISPIGCVQVTNVDNQNISILKEFYLAYFTEWTNDSDAGILAERLDSLQKKYCTENLRRELIKQSQASGLDYDMFTNNYLPDDESIKTLEVIADRNKKNGYIVTFFVNTTDPTNKRIKEKVTVCLTMIKVKEEYRIDDIK